jgi:pullulanase
MVESGTHLPNYPSIKTSIDHLVELGVTHVQILPFYDFATSMYNWGYDPVNYNVPEDQYAMDPNDYNRRVRELREMIKAFHAKGIRVVMDVVYNHTFSKEMFENITSKYYHPAPTDLSGCGNSIDTSHPMVRRFIRDSLEFWVREYGIDGFRFDLIGVFHYDAVKEWGEYLNQQYPDRTLLLYGEPWNGYAADPIESQRVRLGTVPSLASAHVGVFNPGFREAIKGNNDGISKGYMFNNGVNTWWGGIAVGMRGSLKAVNNTNNLPNLWDSMYAVNPEQTINYISAHDNFGLWDKVYLSLSSNVSQNSSHQVLSLTPPSNLDYPKRVARFGMGMVLTSQGIPFIHAGDEFLRTKTNNEEMNNSNAWNYGQHGGTHNTYNAPDSFNAIRWTRKVSEAATYNFYKDLVALRRARPGLRLQTWEQVKNRVETKLDAGVNAASAPGVNLVHDGSLPSNVFISYIDEDNNLANGHELIVVFNSGNNWTLTPPSGTWRKIFGPSGSVNENNFTCEGTAITVFIKQ